VTPEILKERLTAFSVAVIGLCREVRARRDGAAIADQLSDSATSMAATYRSACRARSRREFIAKLGIAVEESDETVGWLDTILRDGMAPEASGRPLLTEAQELLAILAASRRTAEARR
jgi:four helix bundle protein